MNQKKPVGTNAVFAFRILGGLFCLIFVGEVAF